jgi:hypothetical protein
MHPDMPSFSAKSHYLQEGQNISGNVPLPPKTFYHLGEVLFFPESPISPWKVPLSPEM